MNRTKLKNYAPQARKDFIQAVTDKAAQYGLTAAKIEPMTEKGDVVLIAGKPFPKAIGDKRKRLEERIKKYGFEQTMEAMAYTWFNRLVAIRYMELHGYLEHGYRVLSRRPTTDNTDTTDGSKSVSSVTSVVEAPEILEKAQYVDLPGLDRKKVIELKLDGTKEEELYRLLLTAQFNALSKAMPFLYEKIDDETELLLPDSLLNSDSLIRKLVSEIDEEDWQAVEIIGWLYQFYISDKKDEVIGKVVKSEDIPAATQLFTPNWIVKYLVQNTIGRQWLATYPQSSLRSKMEYYIEPAEQTPEIQEQLKAITPTSLNPEELTLLDPACGSGHILVEAYELFKAIYEERGYRAKDIPALILQKNLFGLEIDDRAAQLAAFALMMKARADYPRIFDSEAQPNVLSFVESKGLDSESIHYALMSPLPSEKQVAEPPRPEGFLFETEDNLFTHAAEKEVAERNPSANDTQSIRISKEDITSLISLFENAKTFGSLTQVPPKLASKLPEIDERLDDVLKFGDLTHGSARILDPLLQQARLLARQYDAVVANPPYMGWKYFAGLLKRFVEDCYKDSKGDLYSCFIERSFKQAKLSGYVGLITIPNWMSLSTFEAFRRKLFEKQAIDSFILNGRGVFGSDFGSCAFVIRNAPIPTFRGIYRKLFEKQGSVSSNCELQERFHNATAFFASVEELKAIPGHPVAFTTSKRIREIFASCPPMSSFGKACSGHQTGNNSLFLRYWHEVDHRKIGFGFATPQEALASRQRWFPHKKGGEFRRWYGNCEYVMDWENDGERIRMHPSSALRNPDYQFREGVTWSHTSISVFSARYSETGSTFNVEGPTFFSTKPQLFLGYLCSAVANELFHILSPTVHFLVGTVSLLPHSESAVNDKADTIEKVVQRLLVLARLDWNSCENAWDFGNFSMLTDCSVALAFEAWNTLCAERLTEAKRLEEENNSLFINAYGLQDELSSAIHLPKRRGRGKITTSLPASSMSCSMKRVLSMYSRLVSRSLRKSLMPMGRRLIMGVLGLSTGAERLLEFRVDSGWLWRGVLIGWTEPQQSPHLRGTGTWGDTAPGE